MGRHRAVSISMPEELADEINAYCAKTEISLSRYVVKLVEAGLKASELTRYTIPATIRSTI